MAPFEFPKLNLSSPDADLRYMALFDFARRISSHIYNESPGVYDSIAQLAIGLADKSDLVRTQAMSVVGQVVRSCPYPAVARDLLTMVPVATVIEQDSVSGLLQIYRDILTSIPMSKTVETPSTLSIAAERSYCSIVATSLIPKLLGPVSNFRMPNPSSGESDSLFRIPTDTESSLFQMAPSDVDRSAILEAVLMIIDTCGPGLSDDHLIIIFSACWAIVQSRSPNLALRGQAVKALVALSGHAPDHWIWALKQRAELALKAAPSESSANVHASQKDCLLILKGLLIAHPLKFVDGLGPLQDIACRFSHRVDYDPIDDEARLEMYVNVTEAGLGLWEALGAIYPHYLTLDTESFIQTPCSLLTYDPGAMDDYFGLEHPGFDDGSDCDYEEELGFGDVENSAWRLRAGTAKLVTTLARTQPAAFGPIKSRSGIVAVLAQALRDRVPEVTQYAATALTAMFEAMPTEEQAREECRTQDWTPVLDGVSAVVGGTSVPAKQEALVLLATMIRMLGPGAWPVFETRVGPVLALLRQASAQARHSEGTYAAEALAVVWALLDVFSGSQLEPSAEALVGAMVDTISGSSPAVVTAALEVVPSLVRFFEANTSGTQAALFDQLFRSIIDAAQPGANSAAVTGFAVDTLAHMVTRDVPYDITTGHAALDLIFAHFAADRASPSALKALGAASKARRPGLYSNAWLKAVTDALRSQLADPNCALASTWFLIAHDLAEIVRFSGRSRENEAVLAGLAACMVPYITPDSSDDNSAVEQSLHALALVVAAGGEDQVLEVPGLSSHFQTVVLQSRLVDSLVTKIIALTEEIVNPQFRLTVAQGLYGALNHAVSLTLVGRVIGVCVFQNSPEAQHWFDQTLSTLGSETTSERARIVGVVAACEAVLRNPTLWSSHVPPETPLNLLGPAGVSAEHQASVAVALGRAAVGDPDRYFPAIRQAMAAPLDPARPDDEGLSICIHSIAEFVECSDQLSRPDAVAALAEEIHEIVTKAVLAVPKTRPTAVRALGLLLVLVPAYQETALSRLSAPESPVLQGLLSSVVEFWILHPDRRGHGMTIPPQTVLEQYVVPLSQSPDVGTCEYTALALNSIAFQAPDLARSLLPNLQAAALNLVLFEPDLVRQVRMGPFVRDFDDGLVKRKSGYELAYTLLGIRPVWRVLADWYSICVKGLAEDAGVRVAVCLVLERVWDSLFSLPASDLHRLTVAGRPVRTEEEPNSRSGAPGQNVVDVQLQRPDQVEYPLLLSGSRRVTVLTRDLVDLLSDEPMSESPSRVKSLCTAISTVLGLNPPSSPTQTRRSQNTTLSSTTSTDQESIPKPPKPHNDEHGEQASRMAAVRLAHHVYTCLVRFYDVPIPAPATASASAQARQMYQQRTLGLQVQPVPEIERTMPSEVVLVVELWREIVRNHWDLALLIESGAGARR